MFGRLLKTGFRFEEDKMLIEYPHWALMPTVRNGD